MAWETGGDAFDRLPSPMHDATSPSRYLEPLLEEDASATSRSSVGSTSRGSRSVASSSRRRRARQRPTVRSSASAPSVGLGARMAQQRNKYDWGQNDSLRIQHSALTAELGRAVLDGRPIPKRLLQKLTQVETRALDKRDVKARPSPGPGHYEYRPPRARGGKIGKKAGAAEVFRSRRSDGGLRVKSKPADLGFKPYVSTDSATRSLRRAKQAARVAADTSLTAEQRRAGRVRAWKMEAAAGYAATTEEIVPMPSSIGDQSSSLRSTAPSFSMVSRRPVKRESLTKDARFLDQNGGAYHKLSGFPSAPGMIFTQASRGPKKDGVWDEEARNAPSVHSYDPNAWRTQKPTSYSAKMLFKVEPEYNPFLDVKAAPGSYEHESSMGKQANGLRRTNPAASFGVDLREGGDRTDPLKEVFFQAHERFQPMGVRNVKVATFTSRAVVPYKEAHKR